MSWNRVFELHGALEIRQRRGNRAAEMKRKPQRQDQALLLGLQHLVSATLKASVMKMDESTHTKAC